MVELGYRRLDLNRIPALADALKLNRRELAARLSGSAPPGSTASSSGPRQLDQQPQTFYISTICCMSLDPAVQQEKRPVLAQSLQPLDQSVTLYRRMLHFWELHLVATDPDLRQLGDIHHALCRLAFDLQPSSSTSACTIFVRAFARAGSCARTASATVGGNALGELEAAVAETEA